MEKKKLHCMDCDILIARGSKRCDPCNRKLRANPKKVFHCEQCNKEIIDYAVNRRWEHIFCSNVCQGRWKMYDDNPACKSEAKEKISKFWKGRNIGKPAWNRGKIDPRRRVIDILRCCHLYIEWRKAVYNRDHFKCTICEGGPIEAHHIKAFSTLVHENNINSYEDGLACSALWDIENGQTLCKTCHRETDNYGFKTYNNRKQKVY